MADIGRRITNMFGYLGEKATEVGNYVGDKVERAKEWIREHPNLVKAGMGVVGALGGIAGISEALGIGRGGGTNITNTSFAGSLPSAPTFEPPRYLPLPN